MILTKDNLLRYVREHKAVTPAMVAETFDTTTMIASAALSEIAKEKTIAITHLKLSSSPYYYDPRQKECLIELGEKHLSKGEKDIFLRLQESQILNDKSLTIQEKLAIDKIKDFAVPLEINFQNNTLLFWVWFLRDIAETRKQLLEALTPPSAPKQQSAPQPKPKQTRAAPQPSPRQQATQPIANTQIREELSLINKQYAQRQAPSPSPQPRAQPTQAKQPEYDVPNAKEHFESHVDDQESAVETFIENFLRKNYLKVESKSKDKKGILYETALIINKIKIEVDCYYFNKKPTDAQLIRFYTSSLKPKIVFIEKCPKKILKLAEGVENLQVVNV